MSIWDVIKEEHVLQAIAKLDVGLKTQFGTSTKYELEHDGMRYAPKEVVGVAYALASGEPLENVSLFGGEGAGKANSVLKGLGFEVVEKDWTDKEVRLTVADYFEMLRKEMAKKKFKKADHYRKLKEQLNSRSESSIQRKYSEI